MQKIFPPQERILKIKQLYYRSTHRGCKETDILLGKFADRYLSTFTDEELLLYETFLEESDMDIFQWVTGKAVPPATYNTLIISRLT